MRALHTFGRARLCRTPLWSNKLLAWAPRRWFGQASSIYSLLETQAFMLLLPAAWAAAARLTARAIAALPACVAACIGLGPAAGPVATELAVSVVFVLMSICERGGCFRRAALLQLRAPCRTAPQRVCHCTSSPCRREHAAFGSLECVQHVCDRGLSLRSWGMAPCASE